MLQQIRTQYVPGHLSFCHSKPDKLEKSTHQLQAAATHHATFPDRLQVSIGWLMSVIADVYYCITDNSAGQDSRSNAFIGTTFKLSRQGLVGYRTGSATSGMALRKGRQFVISNMYSARFNHNQYQPLPDEPLGSGQLRWIRSRSRMPSSVCGVR